MTALADIKSWLFVPALQEKYLARALESRAGAFILDLEDSIPAGRKDEARQALAGMLAGLRAGGRPIFVRVNLGDRADIEACAATSPDGVILPKAETANDVRTAEAWLVQAGGALALGFMPAIESAAGVLNARELTTASDQVSCLMFGTGDFVADTGFAMDPDALHTPAALIALAARAGGLPAFGLPGSIGEMADLDKLRQSAVRARAIGYAGAPVIHPKQVETIEAAFSPSPEEVADAGRIVAAFEASAGGATALDGRLIERPVYLRAKATLRRAGADLL